MLYCNLEISPTITQISHILQVLVNAIEPSDAHRLPPILSVIRREKRECRIQIGDQGVFQYFVALLFSAPIRFAYSVIKTSERRHFLPEKALPPSGLVFTLEIKPRPQDVAGGACSDCMQMLFTLLA